MDDIVYKLCKNCYNCLIKDKICRCKLKYWENIEFSKINTMSPYDFDCVDGDF